MIYFAAIFMILIGGSLIILPKHSMFTIMRIHRKSFKPFKKVKVRRIKSWLVNIKFIKNFKMDQRDKEIYEAISYLRNMNTIGSAQGMSADSLLEELAQLQGGMKKIYLKMLSLLRVNDKEKSAEVMYESVGSEISKDFGRLIIRWDDIDPKELMEILVSHQKAIKEKRNTYQKKKDEIISDIIYLPVVLNVILILFNFIYVAYFIEQQTMFNGYF